MLTENEICNSWRRLFGAKAEMSGPDVFEKAEALLEELRPESPLRHRLQLEMEELRNRANQAAKPASRRGRRKIVTAS